MARAPIGRLVRWGFPVVTLMVTIASQVAVPRLLQVGLSDPEYIAYVAVISVVSYIGLADGGLQWSLMREMSEAHGAKDRERFAAEAKRALRLFAAMGLVALLIASALLGSALDAAAKVWPAARYPGFENAVALELGASCLLLGLGYHSALLYTTGRLLAAQVAGLATKIGPTIVLIIALVSTRSLSRSLFAHGVSLLAVAAVRAGHAYWIGKLEIGDAKPSSVKSPLREVLSSGIALKIADVLPMSAFPHALTVFAGPFAPAAVPARTYVGAPRMIVQQFLSLLQIHITRRLAGKPEDRADGEAQYRAAAGFLTAIHLAQVGVIAAILVPVFRLWLPARAAEVTSFVPGLLAEQILLAAAMPSSIMFTALGRLRFYGVWKVVGVVLGLATFLLLLPTAKEAAFGIGFAVSGLFQFGIGLYAELGKVSGFAPPGRLVIGRYGLAALGGASCLFYVNHPYLVSGALLVLGLILLPFPARALWRMFRGVPPLEA